DDRRSLTLAWDSYVVDWPLLLQVGLPAHVVAARALGLSLAPDSDASGNVASGGEQPAPDRLLDAQKAKQALIDAIADDDISALSALANFWNSGFDLEAMPKDD